MRRLSRFALVAALAAVAAQATRAAEVDALLPPETEAVAYVNFKQVLDSDLFKKYALPKFKEAMKMGDAAAMLEKLGLDPLKDIASATVGLWGTDPQDMKVVGVLRGTFDGDKLFKAAEEFAKAAGDKMSIVEEGDFKLIKFVGDNGKPGFASVADNKTLLIGTDKKVVAASLTAKKNGAKAKLNKDLTALVLKQDEKASMFFCGMTDGKFNAIPGNINGIPGIDGDQLKEQLNKMVNAGLTLRVGKDVTVELTTGMKDADAADGFGANVDKLIGLAKTFLPLAAGSAPQAKPLIDDLTKTLKHKVAKSDVTISLKLSAEAIGTMAGGEEK